MQLRYLLIYLTLFLGTAVNAGEDSVKVMRLEEDAASPAARIEDIAWLAGHWSGTGLGGTAEDIISPAADGQMMGMFRHLKADGSINFYEFYVFAEKDGSLTQRLKHFSLPLSSWEEKDEYVEFPLVAISENSAHFDGLTYRLKDDGSLLVAVRLNEEKTAVFNYRKVE